MIAKIKDILVPAIPVEEKCILISAIKGCCNRWEQIPSGPALLLEQWPHEDF